MQQMLSPSVAMLVVENCLIAADISHTCVPEGVKKRVHFFVLFKRVNSL